MAAQAIKKGQFVDCPQLAGAQYWLSIFIASGDISSFASS